MYNFHYNFYFCRMNFTEEDMCDLVCGIEEKGKHVFKQLPQETELEKMVSCWYELNCLETIAKKFNTSKLQVIRTFEYYGVI